MPHRTSIPKLKILVTGSSGAVGYHVAAALRKRGHEVRGFDLRPQRLPGDHRIASILDIDALQNAAKGMDALVHTAAVPDRQNFANALVPNNIVGTQNVFEVARLEGINRVVNTSSVRVVGGLDWATDCIGLDAGFVPGDHYGITKATGELIGAMYARRFGISVVSARLGWFVRNQKEADLLGSLPAGPRIYLSHDDAKDFFIRAVEKPDIAHCAVYVTSYNGGDSAFDLVPANQLFGFKPKDSFPNGSTWSEEEDFPSPEMAPSLRPKDR
jgi:uronate dehydrogenase